MEYVDIGRVFVSLAGVLALIMLVAWGARKLGLQKRFASLRNDARLQLVESLYIDSRHRVVILRRDGREHVLLVSQQQTLVLESYDTPSPTR